MANRLALYCGLLGLLAVLLVACSNEPAPAPENVEARKGYGYGADSEAKDDDGGTPLHHAAALNGNPAEVQALLDAGADAEAKDDIGRTHLDIARAEGNSAIIGLLQ